jgi:peptide chain release factor 1
LRSGFSTNEILVEIRHGEGGDDSKNFVDELFSAYLKYCRFLGLKSELLYSGEGYKAAKITGQDVGKHFAHEAGKHICQRIPETETKGRKHTSVVSVAVLPLRKDVSEVLAEQDLKIEAVNLGGSGGQHQNRTLSGCRITHLPTKLQAVINGRSYHSNEKEARKVLAARVYDLRKQQADDEYAALRRDQIQGGGRSGKLRTYNFMNSRVVDHVLGTKTGDIKGVMKGNFQRLFKN